MRKRKVNNPTINEMKMRLLILLPSFQKDVIRMREMFGVPQEGYNNQKESSELEWKIISPANQDDQAIANLFEEQIENLVIKYRLPYHFGSYLGDYIISNKISAPYNDWIVESNGSDDKKHSTFTTLRIYNPLSKKELQKAIGTIKRFQKEFLAPETNKAMRARKHFERDLRLLEDLRIKRTGRPKEIKRYKEGSYLHILQKRNGITPQNKYQLEKMHPDSVEIIYTHSTSKDVAKKEKMKKDAARKAAERMSKLTIELFGVSLPKDNNGNI